MKQKTTLSKKFRLRAISLPKNEVMSATSRRPIFPPLELKERVDRELQSSNLEIPKLIQLYFRSLNAKQQSMKRSQADRRARPSRKTRTPTPLDIKSKQARKSQETLSFSSDHSKSQLSWRTTARGYSAPKSESKIQKRNEEGTNDQSNTEETESQQSAKNSNCLSRFFSHRAVIFDNSKGIYQSPQLTRSIMVSNTPMQLQPRSSRLTNKELARWHLSKKSERNHIPPSERLCGWSVEEPSSFGLVLAGQMC